MKQLRLLALTILAFNFLACSQTNKDEIGGEDVTQQFLNDYNGTFEEQKSEVNARGERLIIDRNGQIEVLKFRRVGKKGNPSIPEDTICSFLLHGQVAYVVQLDDKSRLRTSEEGRDFLLPRTHNLVFSVYQVSLSDELHPESTTSQGCINFQEQMNQRLPVYTYGLELFGSGTLRLHTTGEADYQGDERSDRTLDEVFIRQ